MSEDKPPFVRIFTGIVKLDTKGGPQKQFFDVPLLKAPPPMAHPITHEPLSPPMSDWQSFMTNFLQHRGMLVEGAWIPERMVELILVNPPSEMDNTDLTNVVAFKR